MDKNLYITLLLYMIVDDSEYDRFFSAFQLTGELIEQYIPENDPGGNKFTDFVLSTTLSTNEQVSLVAFEYLYKILFLENLMEKTKAEENAKMPSEHEQEMDTESDDEPKNFFAWIFNMPESVLETCDVVFTEERLQYILDDFNKHQKPIVDILIEPDDYICNLITTIVATPLRADKIILKNLSSQEYEHPDDREALQALSGNKTLDKIVKLYSEYNIERLVKIQYTGSNVLVTENNIPYLYHILLKACEILDIQEIPELYLEQGFIDACTIGVSKPIIVVSYSALSLLNYDELLFLIGHELGHIKSQHVLYHTMAKAIPYIGGIVGNLTFGFGDIVAQGIELMLYNWYRKSEFTADRAGLLVCQNLDVAMSVLTKAAGYPIKYYDSMDPYGLLEQAGDFNELDNSTYNKIMKVLSAMYQDHPWTVMRAQELYKWVADDSCDNLIDRYRNEPEENVPVVLAENECFCDQCGFKIHTDDKFCKKCGEPNKQE